MKKFLVGAAALLINLHAVADKPDTEKAQKLGHEIAVFYKNPSDTRAANLMDSLIGAGIMRNTALVWGTQALQKYPRGSTIWCNKIRNYQGDAQTFAAYTLAMTGTRQAKACLDSLTLDTELKHKIAQSKALHPLQEPIISPASLDFHWVTYFATGNSEAVERIIDYIGQAQAVAEQHPNRIDLTLSSAVWSARSNMQQDPAIDSIVRKYIQRQPETNKKRLEQTLLKPQNP